MSQNKENFRSITIVSSREEAHVLQGSIERAVLASKKIKTTINVLVNGNFPLAKEISQRIQNFTNHAININVWSIPLGDKANAWNLAIHHLYDGEDIAIFIDGYVKVNFDAFENLSESLSKNNHALAASGIPPIENRSVEFRNQILNQGGMHGNLCALKGSTIKKLQLRKAFLPLGLYRTDSTLGAFICFNLSPSEHNWDATRIFVSEKASWEANHREITKLKDVITQLRRVMRQNRGIIENEAIRNHLAIKKQSISSLPKTTHLLCLNWCLQNKSKAIWLALKKPLVIPYLFSLFKNNPAMKASPPQLVSRH